MVARMVCLAKSAVLAKTPSFQPLSCSPGLGGRRTALAPTHPWSVLSDRCGVFFPRLLHISTALFADMGREQQWLAGWPDGTIGRPANSHVQALSILMARRGHAWPAHPSAGSREANGTVVAHLGGAWGGGQRGSGALV